MTLMTRTEIYNHVTTNTDMNERLLTPSYLILGYFFRENLGDDIFLDVWKYLIDTCAPENATAVFGSLEDSPEQVVSEWTKSNPSRYPSAIIVAGGDVLTEYFSVRIRNVVRELENSLNTGKRTLGDIREVPIYGVSVAAPFESAVHLGFCDLYSHLLLRPSSNTQSMWNRIGMKFVDSIPDISCYLIPMYGAPPTKAAPKDKKRLAVCIAAQLCGKGLPVYNDNIHNIARGIVDAYIKCKFDEVVFLPFDTSGSDSDDTHINDDICTAMQSISSVLEVDVRVKHAYDKNAHSVHDVFTKFVNGSYDVALCGRYHSHMMSILSHTPVASVCVTQKVRSLLQELDGVYNMPCVYQPTLDEEGVPYDYDAARITNAIVCAHDNNAKIKSAYKAYCVNLKTSSLHALDKHIRDILKCKIIRPGRIDVRQLKSVAEQSEDCLTRVLSWIETRFGVECVSADVLDKFRKKQITFGDIIPASEQNEELMSFMASMICTYATYDMYPAFHYGLFEKILTTQYILDDIHFLIHEHSMVIGRKRDEASSTVPTQVIEKSKKLFYCPGINRLSLWGIHRAGWEYVLRHLWYSHADDKNLPVFDDYVDSTFNWMSDVMAALGKIPYRKPWFGCIHHTSNQDSGPNNLENVFNNPLFVQSLKKCTHLIAMSKNLSEELKKRLAKVGMSHVKVHEMVHPSEIPLSKFNWNDFLQNDNRMLVQIGCWYRDPYMLYTLDIPKKSWIRKAALRGLKMHNNFPPSLLRINATSDDPPMDIGINIYDSEHTIYDNSMASIYRNQNKNRSIASKIMMCRPDSASNSFVINMLKSILKDLKSVKIMEYLDNEEYDEMLTKNVVYLHMIDAGAINTLVECVIRNTPILINRLPAVEQVLGSDYPLFYDNATTAALLACSSEKIKAAHIHLSKLDKERYTIEYFLKQFAEILNKQ